MANFLSDWVFIHRSIKTRIETNRKIGLEPDWKYVFIHRSIKTRIETFHYILKMDIKNQFLYIDPLKQGLKLWDANVWPSPSMVFIHRSIKTRIETSRAKINMQNNDLFLYIDPLKQGLKLKSIPKSHKTKIGFYT